MLPANCSSCLHAVFLCSTVADGSTDQLLKFQLSSVKTKVSKTTFKNGYEYRGHPVMFISTIYLLVLPSSVAGPYSLVKLINKKKFKYADPDPKSTLLESFRCMRLMTLHCPTGNQLSAI